MKTSFKQLLTSTLIALVLAGVPAFCTADTNPPAGEAAPAKPKRTTYPFHGTVDSVNASAQTVSLKRSKGGARVLKVDEKSQISINGKLGTLADVQPGKYAHGSVHKDSTGAEVILKAKFDDHAPTASTGAATTAATPPPPATPVAVTPSATTINDAPATSGTNVTKKVKKARKKKSAVTNDVDQATAPATQ